MSRPIAQLLAAQDAPTVRAPAMVDIFKRADLARDYLPDFFPSLVQRRIAERDYVFACELIDEPDSGVEVVREWEAE